MFTIFIYENQEKQRADIEMVARANDTPIFMLRPVRLRALNNKERLKIEIQESNGDKRGEVYCNVMELEKDLYKLREFGTGLLRVDITAIRSMIDRNYRQIGLDKDYGPARDLDRDIEGIARMFLEYIREHKEIRDTKSNCYNIPVEEFKEYLGDSDYIYSYREVKEKFRDLGFTDCNEGRSDRTVNDRGDDKPYKAISFYKDMGERIRALSTDALYADLNEE